MVAWLLGFGDPTQALPRIRAELEAISVQDLQKIAARCLTPEAELALVTGDHPPKDTLLRDLRKPVFHVLQQ